MERFSMAEYDFPLFQGISSYEIPGLLDCVHAKKSTFKAGELILEEGTRVNAFGLMLSGTGRTIKWDPNGRQVIITMLEPGSLIGVMLAASPGATSPLTVEATSDCTVLMIPFGRVINSCGKNCPKHVKLVHNYICALAEKGLELHERINCLLEATVRNKILTYLTRISVQENTRVFTVPLNRNVMAEYLNVERSALSRELSNMKNDGLIDYHRNNFRLL